MVYTGHVEKGAIVLDEPADLPDGAVVKVELANKCVADGEDTGPSFTQRFAEVLGKAQSLPKDAAENHDHYLYGVAKNDKRLR